MMKHILLISLFLICTTILWGYIPGMENDSISNVLASANNDSSKVTLYLELEGQYYLSEPNRALRYNRLALQLSKDIGYKFGEASANNNIGIIYYNKGEFPKSLEYYQKSAQGFKELGKMAKVAIVHNNIGRIYASKKELGEALHYFRLSLGQAQRLNNEKAMINALIGIGVMHKEQGIESESPETKRAHFDSALTRYNQALDIVIRQENRDGEASIYNNIAVIYDSRDEYEQAIELYTKCLIIYEETNSKKGKALAHHNIADALHSLNRLEEATINIEKSLKYSRELGIKEFTSNGYQLLSELHHKQGQFEKAFNNRLKYAAVKDSLFNEDKSQEMGKIEAKYDFEKAEQEEERLMEKLEQEVAEKEIRRNNLQYSGILIFIILLFSGVLLLRRLSIPMRLAEGIIFFTFLLFFEFTLVLLDPYIESFSQGEPAAKLLFNAVLAGLIFPLHSFFETKLKGRIIT